MYICTGQLCPSRRSYHTAVIVCLALHKLLPTHCQPRLLPPHSTPLPQDFCACCSDKGNNYGGDDSCQKQFQNKCMVGTSCATVTPGQQCACCAGKSSADKKADTWCDWHVFGGLDGNNGVSGCQIKSVACFLQSKPVSKLFWHASCNAILLLALLTTLLRSPCDNLR